VPITSNAVVTRAYIKSRSRIADAHVQRSRHAARHVERDPNARARGSQSLGLRHSAVTTVSGSTVTRHIDDESDEIVRRTGGLGSDEEALGRCANIGLRRIELNNQVSYTQTKCEQIDRTMHFCVKRFRCVVSNGCTRWLCALSYDF
jgi:hypothetical protein